MFNKELIRHFITWLAPLLIAGGSTGYILFATFVMAPAIELSESVIDFNDVPAEQEVIRNIEVVNKGRVDLAISRIRTGCGCTKTKLNPNSPIRPGERATLTVTFVPGQSARVSGQIVPIFIFSNDPRNPIRTLIVRAYPSDNISANPEIVDFGRIADRQGLPASREIALRGLSNGVKRDSCVFESRGESCFDVRHIEDSPQGGTHRVILRAAAPVGDICEDFEYRDSSTGVSKRITFRAQVCGRFVALPQMVSLGPIRSSDAPLSEMVRIQARSEDGKGTSAGAPQVTIGKVSADLQDLIRTTIESDDSGASISVIADPAKFKGTWSEKRVLGHIELRVHNSTGDVERVNVPVLLLTKMKRVRTE